ncbi:hypothetical protein E0Z10_g4543 [Xylaria hypoxylon]|uniref:Biogenesis of lysosome-related organelles complex 1 subunit 1 n=1 Tax=Xylaria hypoxylon TaxID=37992 RepID=A0A4Z0Z0D0_9PEZI|nr:hypothetical protein E0Z10_g4543 [Xylaria hypoxylon]
MSDSATANPGAPSPPPVSNPEADRRPSTTASPPNDHVASCSTMAPVGSSSRLSPPSLPSSTSKAPASVSGSRTTATSPPTTVSSGPGPALVHAVGGASTATMSLNPNLLSHDSQRHVAEARAALVASMSNMLDSELQSRASLLHSNTAALSRQEQDVARATEALRKENDKLVKVAKEAGRKIKELGNVQNWAEVLERDFLVLEETMRLVREGSTASDDAGSSCSEYSGSSWSGSESEGERDSTKLRSRAGSRKDSASDLRERQGDGEEKSTTGKEKGKGLNGSALNSCSSTVGGGSTSSNASPTRSASTLLSSMNDTISLDEAILESLTEALATDMHIELASTRQNTA